MTIPRFVEVDGISLPSFLFSFSERKSKSISPAALINPANVNGGNIFQSLISPSDIPSKKTLIFDGQIDVVWTRDRQIGFLQQLKLLGFDVYLCVSNQNENNFLKLDDDLSNINQLNNFSDFNKLSDYEKLADLNISREKSVFLDFKKLNEVKNCFVGHSWENYFQAVDDEEVFEVIKKYYESSYSTSPDIYIKFNSLTAKQIKNAFEQNENFSLKYLAPIYKKITSEEQIKNSERIKDYQDLEFYLTVFSNSPNQVDEILEKHKNKVCYQYDLELLLKKISNKQTKIKILEKFNNLVKDNKEIFLEKNEELSDYFFKKYGRDKFKISTLLKFFPNEAESILQNYKTKDKDDLKYCLKAIPQMAEFILEKDRNYIQIGGDDLMELFKQTPNIAEIILRKNPYIIQNGHSLSTFLEYLPQMAESLLEKYRDKIRDSNDLSLCLEAAPQMAESLLEKYRDKIRDSNDLSFCLKAAPQMAKSLLEKYRDKIRDSNDLLSCLRVAPQMAESLLEKYGDKIRDSNDLSFCLRVVPQMAESLLEKYGDKIRDGNDLLSCLRVAPRMAESLLEKYGDKIRDGNYLFDNDLLFCLGVAPRMAESLLETYGDKIDSKNLSAFLTNAPELRNKIFEKFKNNISKNSNEDKFLPETLDEIISVQANKQNYSKSNNATFVNISKLDNNAIVVLKEEINAKKFKQTVAVRIEAFEGEIDILEDFLQSLPKSVKHLTLPKELQDKIVRLPNDLSIKLVHKKEDIKSFIARKQSNAFQNNVSNIEHHTTLNPTAKYAENTSEHKLNDIFIGNGRALPGLSIKNSGKDKSGKAVLKEKIKAGEILNLTSSEEIRLRTRIIDRNIIESLEATNREPSQYYQVENIKSLSEEEIENLKNQHDKVYCRFEQDLTANETFRLLSISPEEEMVGVRFYDQNKNLIFRVYILDTTKIMFYNCAY